MRKKAPFLICLSLGLFAAATSQADPGTCANLCISTYNQAANKCEGGLGSACELDAYNTEMDCITNCYSLNN